MEYQYCVTIKGAMETPFIDKLIKYLKSILNQIKKGENLKIILNSEGGDTDCMKVILSLLREIHQKGAILDMYCYKTQSAALIMLVLLKNENRLNKVYAKPYSLFMWHKPQFFVEFEGKLTSENKKNRLVMKDDIVSLLSNANKLVDSLQEINQEYQVWEDMYLDIITKSFISSVKEEIEKEYCIMGDMAKYRGLVDEILGDKFTISDI